MEFIKLIPKTQRAKNRVREHGDTFKVERRDNPQCFGGRPSILLRNLEDGWQGWFVIAEEEWQELELVEK